MISADLNLNKTQNKYLSPHVHQQVYFSVLLCDLYSARRMKNIKVNIGKERTGTYNFSLLCSDSSNLSQEILFHSLQDSQILDKSTARH